MQLQGFQRQRKQRKRDIDYVILASALLSALLSTLLSAILTAILSSAIGARPRPSTRSGIEKTQIFRNRHICAVFDYAASSAQAIADKA